MLYIFLFIAKSFFFCLGWDFATETNPNGVSKTSEQYTRIWPDGKMLALGDARVLTTKSLHCKEPRTFKDELYTIISSWRLIYGEFPWTELAKKYARNHSVTVEQIEQARQTDIKVI